MRGSERGTTLVETLVVLVLVSLAVTLIANAVVTSIRVNAMTREQQRRELALTSFGEAIKQLPWRQECPETANRQWYQNAYNALPAADRRATDGMNPTIQRLGGGPAIAYWQNGTFPSVGVQTPGAFTGTCSADRGAQRITFTVTLAGETVEAQVVKRK
jgi:type II secretory pathway pseudopilin PulG